ncbi:MAG: DNA primase [Sphaerochaetaceae bacterium]|nr:DNA primase [Sphaerochaetaceae bacterium]
MARYSDKTIEEIKSKLSIVDVVATYTQVFHKNGEWIKCPFHGNGNERTPSCKLNLERGSYYCFGCHEHGSMFDFVMKMDKVSFPESVKILADKAGVEVEEMTAEDRKRRDDIGAMFDLYERIQKTFRHILLNDPRGKKARDYLLQRNINDEISEKFSLGYAPADTSWLYNFLKKNGYSDDFLKESGFFSRNKYPWPLFADRLMFPVRNFQGKVVAFGARDLSFRENSPKYINTNETIIYSKKHNLYGIHESLKDWNKNHVAIVCEGNFDAISLHQAGVVNAVAPFGTAFTVDQAKLISRYCDKIQLLFDSDEAGQKATRDSLIMLQGLGIQQEVLRIDGAKDASELLEKKGAEEVKNIISTAVTGYSYLEDNGLKLYNIRTPKGLTDFLSYMAPYINATTSEVERASYIRLISELSGIQEEKVESDLNKARSSESPRYEKVVDVQNTRPKPFSAAAASPDLYLMLMLANHRELFPRYTSVLKFGDIRDKEAQHIYVALENVRREDDGRTDEVFLSLFADEAIRSDVSASFELEEFKPERPEEVIDELLDRLKLRRLEERQKTVSSQLQRGEMEGFGEGDLAELLAEKMDVDREILEMRNRLRAGWKKGKDGNDG